jgi:RNA polymerase sigma-54 factor
MLNLQQKQSLQQKLSPQQIQYIKLLQLPTLELEQRIKEEMEMNPLLEEGEDEDDEVTTPSPTSAPRPRPRTRPTASEGNDDEEFDWDEFLNAPDDLYGYKAQRGPLRRGGAPRDPHALPLLHGRAPPRPDRHARTLRDRRDSSPSRSSGPSTRTATSAAPSSPSSTTSCSRAGLMLTDNDVEPVLRRIQRLDPLGIGSRDLQECMLVQLEAMPDEWHGRRASRSDMIRDAYKAFTMKHFEHDHAQARHRRGGAEGGVRHHPAPRPQARRGGVRPSTNYVTPDFTVEDRRGVHHQLNGKNAPELRINRHYKQMWNELSAKKRKPAPQRPRPTRPSSS